MSSGIAEGTLIVDMGERTAKQISKLKNGRGKLAESVQETVDELTRSGSIPEGTVPLIVIVKERARTVPGF